MQNFLLPKNDLLSNVSLQQQWETPALALILLYNAINLQLRGDLNMSGLVWFGFFILLFLSPSPCFKEKISIHFKVLERAACF